MLHMITFKPIISTAIIMPLLSIY